MQKYKESFPRGKLTTKGVSFFFLEKIDLLSLCPSLPDARSGLESRVTPLFLSVGERPADQGTGYLVSRRAWPGRERKRCFSEEKRKKPFSVRRKETRT
jgi:hypothetical protein